MPGSWLRQSLSSLIIPENTEVSVNDRTTNPNVMLDVEQMTQVITNMVKNSFDAMPEGGRIEITLKIRLAMYHNYSRYRNRY
jgi:signal transduction histidine kinase